MKKIAIICEYNPFHGGHEYQIKKAKELYPGSKIIAIMSGHFTQRGKAAAFSKFDRARAALACGADLVLELPFPYCAASAEFFARGGCEIAKAIGADALCFGSESGSLDELLPLSKKLASPYFVKKLEKMRKDEKNRSLGHAALISAALDSDKQRKLIEQPNNILALEYLIALQGSDMTPITIKREGAGYNDVSAEAQFPSATALRALLEHGECEKMLSLVPERAKEVFANAIGRGELVSSDTSLYPLFHAYFRFTSPEAIENFAECDKGLANKIVTAALENSHSDKFFNSLRFKHITDAKLSRALLFAMLQVTPESLRSAPAYTQFLAANKNGCEMLKDIKKCGQIEVLVKPADNGEMSEEAQKQFALSSKADALYTLLLDTKLEAGHYIKSAPYIEK